MQKSVSGSLVSHQVRAPLWTLESKYSTKQGGEWNSGNTIPYCSGFQLEDKKRPKRWLKELSETGHCQCASGAWWPSRFFVQIIYLKHMTYFSRCWLIAVWKSNNFISQTEFELSELCNVIKCIVQSQPTSRLPGNNNINNNNGWQAPVCVSQHHYWTSKMQITLKSTCSQVSLISFTTSCSAIILKCIQNTVLIRIFHNFCLIYLFHILCVKALTAEGSLLFCRVTLDACQHPVAGSDASHSRLFCHNPVAGPASFSSDWSAHILTSWELFKTDIWEFWL